VREIEDSQRESVLDLIEPVFGGNEKEAALDQLRDDRVSTSKRTATNESASSANRMKMAR
jgi:hypothetical protein